MLLMVVIASTIALSSGQSASPECIEAYNATFENVSRDAIACAAAYFTLIAGNATEEQSMMVCSINHQCNNMIENIINLCGRGIQGTSQGTNTSAPGNTPSVSINSS